MNKLYKCLSLLSLFFIFNSVHAEQVIKVGVFIQPPFAFATQKTYKGLSVDIWKELANNANIKYEFVTANSEIEQAFEGLANAKYDVLIGAFSITPKRIETFEFARPYYISRLSAVSNDQHHQFWHIFKDIMLQKWMVYLYFALLILFIFSFIHAIVEEKGKSNRKILRKVIYRIFYRYILVLVSSNPIEEKTTTLTTRLTNITTLLISLIFFSAFLSAMSAAMTISTSNLTYSSMSDYDDLYDRKIIVVKNTYADVFMKRIDITKYLVEANSFDDATTLLLKDKHAIMVGNYLQLKSYIKRSNKINTDPEVIILGASEYAFAVRANSHVLKQINTEIVKMREKQEIQPICRKYLTPKDSRDCIG